MINISKENEFIVALGVVCSNHCRILSHETWPVMLIWPRAFHFCKDRQSAQPEGSQNFDQTTQYDGSSTTEALKQEVTWR